MNPRTPMTPQEASALLARLKKDARSDKVLYPREVVIIGRRAVTINCDGRCLWAPPKRERWTFTFSIDDVEISQTDLWRRLIGLGKGGKR